MQNSLPELKKPFEGTVNPERKPMAELRGLEKGYSDLYRELIQSNKTILEREARQLTNYAESLRAIEEQVKEFQQQGEQNIKKLNRQIKSLQVKINQSNTLQTTVEQEEKQRKHIANLQKDYINSCQQRIKLAEQLDPQLLSKLDLEDRKSIANQVFKWILVTIYGQPESKYYWPNFQEEVFLKDKGLDFKERMGKVSAFHAKEDHKIKTQYFLNNFEKIKASKELQKVAQQLDLIQGIAKQFKNCVQIIQTIKKDQEKIKSIQEESNERQEEIMQWKARLNALQARVETSEKYLASLANIQNVTKGKGEIFLDEKQRCQKLLTSIEKLPYSPTVYVGEKKDDCECKIF